MKYRIPKNDKNEFLTTAKNLALFLPGKELNQATIENDSSSDKVVIILQDEFVNALSDEQKGELLGFVR